MRLARVLRAGENVPLGLSKRSTLSMPDVSVGKFFDEKYFWTKANVGPFFTCLLLTPFIYTSVKDLYWTREMRKLNTAELIEERREWLHKEMVKDEVYACALDKLPAGGFQ